MAKYKIIVYVEGSRIDAVVKKAKEAFGEDATVRKSDLSKSRADRLADIRGEIENAASDVDELNGEMQEWLDSLPENLQGGDKASELQEAIDALEALKDELENVNFDDVSFPSMMG